MYCQRKFGENARRITFESRKWAPEYDNVKELLDIPQTEPLQCCFKCFYKALQIYFEVKNTIVIVVGWSINTGKNEEGEMEEIKYEWDIHPYEIEKIKSANNDETFMLFERKFKFDDLEVRNTEIYELKKSDLFRHLAINYKINL